MCTQSWGHRPLQGQRLGGFSNNADISLHPNLAKRALVMLPCCTTCTSLAIPLSQGEQELCIPMNYKYPRQRSAFTYWEDKIPSRIDLAKSKYGGPFTTEQVEDVKTFFRILVIIFSVGAIVSANIVTAGVERNMVWHLRGHGTPKSDSLSVCFQVNSIRNLEYYCNRTSCSPVRVYYAPHVSKMHPKCGHVSEVWNRDGTASHEYCSQSKCLTLLDTN